MQIVVMSLGRFKRFIMVIALLRELFQVISPLGWNSLVFKMARKFWYPKLNGEIEQP